MIYFTTWWLYSSSCPADFATALRVLLPQSPRCLCSSREHTSLALTLGTTSGGTDFDFGVTGEVHCLFAPAPVHLSPPQASADHHALCAPWVAWTPSVHLRLHSPVLDAFFAPFVCFLLQPLPCTIFSGRYRHPFRWSSRVALLASNRAIVSPPPSCGDYTRSAPAKINFELEIIIATQGVQRSD